MGRNSRETEKKVSKLTMGVGANLTCYQCVICPHSDDLVLVQNSQNVLVVIQIVTDLFFYIKVLNKRS